MVKAKVLSVFNVLKKMKQSPLAKALLFGLIFWSFPMSEAIPRQYNYTLSTKTVGVDDNRLASVLYNINRMEMKSEYETENKNKALEALGETLYMVADCVMHMETFAEEKNDKVDQQTVKAVLSKLKAIALSLREAGMDNVATADMCRALQQSSKQALSVVDDIVKLDEQAFKN